jgi:hypothetical protein
MSHHFFFVYNDLSNLYNRIFGAVHRIRIGTGYILLLRQPREPIIVSINALVMRISRINWSVQRVGSVCLLKMLSVWLDALLLM